LLLELQAIVIALYSFENPTLKLIRLVKQLKLVKTFSHEVVAHGTVLNKM
jgi:hypothetical protein